MRCLYLVLLISSTIIPYSYAQEWEPAIQLQSGLGQEWNIFKNPNNWTVQNQDIPLNYLQVNGMYGFVGLNTRGELDWGHHRLKGSLNGAIRYFTNQPETHYYDYRGALSWRIRYAKRKYFEIAPSYQRKNQLGLGREEVVWRIPMSYRKITVPVHLDFYLGNLSWLKTEAGFFYKSFDVARDEDYLFYRSPFASVEWSKKWKKPGITWKLEVEGEVETHAFQLNEADFSGTPFYLLNGLERGIDQKNWRWTYQDLLARVKVESQTVELEVFLRNRYRKDNRDITSYNEIMIGIQGEWILQRGTVEAHASYAFQDYPEFTPGPDALNELLHYHYVRAGIEGTLKIGRQAEIFMEGNLINRASNFNDADYLGFRSYFNASMMTGIRLKL